MIRYHHWDVHGVTIRPPGRAWVSQAGETWSTENVARTACPDCQTPVESVQAEANAAELRVRRESGGQFAADPVLCMTGTVGQPGEILYGTARSKRAHETGRTEGLSVVERLPAGTRCVPTVGGVTPYLPEPRAS